MSLERHSERAQNPDFCQGDVANTSWAGAFPDPSEPLPWLADLNETECLSLVELRLQDVLGERRFAFVPNALQAQLDVRGRLFDRASRRVEGLLLEQPERRSLLVLQGVAELGQGEQAKARATFRRLTEFAPEVAASKYLLAMTYSMVGDRERRRDELEQALAIEPDFLEADLELVLLDALDGQLQRASERVQLLEARNPDDGNVHEIAGTITLLRRDYPASISSLETALAVGPTAIRAMKLALAFDRAEDVERGSQALMGWLESHPSDVEVRLVVANRYLARGDNEAARSHYRKAVLLAPYNFVALNNLAWTELLLENGGVALDLAARAYEVSPDDPRILDTYGLALTVTGDLDGGIEMLRRAVTRDPQNAGARYRLAHALSESGVRDEAKSILQSVLAQQAEFPEREEAKRLLDTL